MIDANDYGVVGDGVTDDTAAIQRALVAALATEADASAEDDGRGDPVEPEAEK